MWNLAYMLPAFSKILTNRKESFTRAKIRIILRFPYLVEICASLIWIFTIWCHSLLLIRNYHKILTYIWSICSLVSCPVVHGIIAVNISILLFTVASVSFLCFGLIIWNNAQPFSCREGEEDNDVQMDEEDNEVQRFINN